MSFLPLTLTDYTVMTSCLQAINNIPIPTYGTRSLTLNLGLRRIFHWAFILADVKRPILGADFLHHFSLDVDVKNHQLLDGLTNLRVQGIASLEQPPSPTLQFRGSDNQFSALRREFPSTTQVSSMNQPVQHHISHHIQTNGPPVSARARRLAPERLKVARREF